jgi:hypothetical protein
VQPRTQEGAPHDDKQLDWTRQFIRWIAAEMAWGAAGDSSTGAVFWAEASPAELATYADLIWLSIYRSGHNAAVCDTYSDLERVRQPTRSHGSSCATCCLSPSPRSPG